MTSTRACSPKNANETKSGAGQYFTPRELIDSMVRVMRPTLDDVIQDPAAGTGGFLIAANHYIREHSDPDSWTEAQQKKYARGTFYGMEHVQDTHRLALMNLMLHELEYPTPARAFGTETRFRQRGSPCRRRRSCSPIPLRHEERRRPADVHRLHVSHEQQAVLLPAAHLPRAAARWTGGRGASDSLVLIDGQQLAELMMDHGVGVTTRETFTLVSVDGDYFEDA